MKKLFSIFLLPLLLFSCSNTAGTDQQWSSYRQQNQIKGTCLETQDAIYSLSNNFVYFTDKGAEPNNWMVLCNKPDCSHSTPDCNGYTGTTSIGYYDGRIYYLMSDQTPDQTGIRLVLHSMNYDGTGHRTEKTLRDDIANIGYGVIFHDQYCIWYESVWDDATESNHDILYLSTLTGDDEPIAVADSDETGAFYYMPAGKYIYLTVRGDDRTTLYRYGLETGETETVIEDWYLPYAGIPTDAYFTDNGAYYFDCQLGLCYYDFADQAATVLREISYQEHGEARSDGQYFYLSTVAAEDHPLEKQELYIYDMDGTLLNQLDLPSSGTGYNPYYLYTASDEYILIASGRATYPLFYLSKEEMLNPGQEWKDCQFS